MKTPWISLKAQCLLSTVFWDDEGDDFETDMFECDVEYYIETKNYYMRFSLDINYTEYYANCFSATHLCHCGSDHFFDFKQPGVSVMYGPRHVILIVSKKCKQIDKVKDAIECFSKVNSGNSSESGTWPSE